MLGQREVHADVERGIFARERGGVLERVAGHHQGRGGQDAVAVRGDDAAVYGLGKAEVVGVNDEPGFGARRHADLPEGHGCGANAQYLQPQ